MTYSKCFKKSVSDKLTSDLLFTPAEKFRRGAVVVTIVSMGIVLKGTRADSSAAAPNDYCCRLG